MQILCWQSSVSYLLPDTSCNEKQNQSLNLYEMFILPKPTPIKNNVEARMESLVLVRHVPNGHDVSIR